jgi:hypothetical protein
VSYPSDQGAVVSRDWDGVVAVVEGRSTSPIELSIATGFTVATSMPTSLVHLGALHRATRGDRRPPLDRDGRGLLRQRTRRDNQRPVQDRVRLRPGHPRLDDVDELELATLSWVHWFNETRLHGHCNDVPPAEYEAAFYAAQQTNPAGVGIQ